ncbi:hypothetical protein NO989_04270 [Alteromonas sp. DY56-G5]|uniref:hypothetical protein n=1 Tax=Alteromonas sp. DY56-G5 TaxID=2967128 RepID=UPI00352A8494
MAITPSQWSHVLTLPESYTPSAATSGQTLVITEGVIAKLSTADQNTFWNAVQNGGGDVRICTDVTGTNQLPVEIISLDNVAQTCVIWTRKATYAGTGELYVFIGKAGETQPAVTDPFGRNAVWSDYLLVWHGQDIAGAIVDSSGNQSNASVTGSVSNAAGAFGYGQSFAFDGSAGRVGLSGNLSGIQGNTETALTYQANVKLSSPPTTNQSIIGSTIDDGSAIAASWMMADNDDTVSGQSDTFILAPNGRSERFGVGGNSANTSSHMLHGLWANGSAGGEALDGSEKYLDGTFVTSNPISEASGFVNLHANFEVGGSADFATSPINGVIDEVRFRIGLLSQSFIATEYANQSDPASFFGTPTISLTSGEPEPETELHEFSGNAIVSALSFAQIRKITHHNGQALITASATASSTKAINVSGGVTVVAQSVSLFEKLNTFNGTASVIATSQSSASKLVSLNGQATVSVTASASIIDGDLEIHSFSGGALITASASGQAVKVGIVSGSVNVTASISAQASKTALLSGNATVSTSTQSLLSKIANITGNAITRVTTLAAVLKRVTLSGASRVVATASGTFFNAESNVETYELTVQGRVKAPIVVQGRVKSLTIQGRVK